MDKYLTSPFPWWGGKRFAADIIWNHFGVLQTYVEPFCGTMAVYLACKYDIPRVIMNDRDGFLVNFWRAVKQQPDEVAYHADYPTSHIDLFVRRKWLKDNKNRMMDMLLNDKDWCDTEIAGIWVWMVCNSIDLGGDLERENRDYSMPKIMPMNNMGMGMASTKLQYPAVSTMPTIAGQGVQSLRDNKSIGRQPTIHDRAGGKGVQAPRRKTSDGDGMPFNGNRLSPWFTSLANKLKHVYILCKDWSDIISPTVAGTTPSSPTDSICGVFLDPPYGTEGRTVLYAEESLTLSKQVQDWAIENSENPRLRICVAGYKDDYDEWPDGWERVIWRKNGSRMGGMKKKITTDLRHCGLALVVRKLKWAYFKSRKYKNCPNKQ